MLDDQTSAVGIASLSQLTRALHYVGRLTNPSRGHRSRIATFVINNFVRDWGHQFIYDEPALSAALRESGS
jgi:hypothetical protein